MGKMKVAVLIVGGTILVGGLTYPMFHPATEKTVYSDAALANRIVKQFNHEFKDGGYVINEGIIGEVKAADVSDASGTIEKIPDVKVVMLTKNVKGELGFLRVVFPNSDGLLSQGKSDGWSYKDVRNSILDHYDEICHGVEYNFQPTTAEILHDMSEASKSQSLFTEPRENEGDLKEAFISGYFIVPDGSGYRCEIESSLLSQHDESTGGLVGKMVGATETISHNLNRTVSLEMTKELVSDTAAFNDAIDYVFQYGPSEYSVKTQEDKFNGEARGSFEQYNQFAYGLEKQPE